MHTTIKNKEYFSHLEMGEINVNTISDSAKLIQFHAQQVIFSINNFV